ncbi:MAG: hypothetical protein HFG22_17465 [Lachnospiraceae bacterium]|nr:hypothetical protein [Lachnospiraceae bacterium]
MDKRYAQKDITGFEKRVAELGARKKAITKKCIVNAGLLKAGKSTLFNALLGERVFESDVIRATVKNQKREAEGYFLLDTPGLDANAQDTKEALTAYAKADAIVFVHNLQEGEFNQVEIDSIEQIGSLYGDKKAFFQKTILALSHKDQVEEEYPDICRRIEEQCEGSIKGHFCKIVCVDPAGYLKGVDEDKELLKKASGIPELKEALRACILNGVDLQSGRLQKEKGELIEEIDDAIAGLEKEIPKGPEISSAAIDRASKDMKKRADKVIKEINDTVKLPLSRTSSGWDRYKCFGREKDYKEYRSEWDARSAGKAVIEASIRSIAKAARGDAMDIVSSAEDCISFEKKPKGIQDRLSDAYEEIRHTALNAGVTISTNFTVVLRDPEKASDGEKSSVYRISRSELEKAHQELSYVRDRARNIDTADFSSATRYAEKESYNLYIDYDIRTEWVKGLFGERMKDVEKYHFDAGGAIDDISFDASDIVDDIYSRAQEAVESAFYQIKRDLTGQFKELTDKMLAEMAEKKEKAEKQEQEIQRKAQAIQDQIARLERCRQAAAGL